MSDVNSAEPRVSVVASRYLGQATAIGRIENRPPHQQTSTSELERNLGTLVQLRRCCFNVQPNSPVRACWLVTTRCDQSCKHCAQLTNREVTSKYEPIRDVTDVDAVVSQLAARGVKHVVLSGGEATLNPMVEPVAHSVVHAGMSCSLSTNALQANIRLYARLMDAGLSRVTVSLDGASAAVHDRQRGDGAFVRTTQNIRVLADLGLDVTVGAFMHRDMLAELTSLPSLCRQLGAHAVDLLAPIPSSHCSGQTDAIGDWEVLSAVHQASTAFASARIPVSLALPTCDSSSCPSGRLVVGVAGRNCIDRCVFK